MLVRKHVSTHRTIHVTVCLHTLHFNGPAVTLLHVLLPIHFCRPLTLSRKATLIVVITGPFSLSLLFVMCDDSRVVLPNVTPHQDPFTQG